MANKPRFPLDTPTDAAHRLGTVMAIRAILSHSPWLDEYLGEAIDDAERAARCNLRAVEES